MKAVRGKNTKPELVVRSTRPMLWGLGSGCTRSNLPGTPDLVFPRLHRVILVHGCFWHRHRGCSATTTPKDNDEFWAAKFRRNVERDRATVKALREQGWQVLVVWQCQTRDASELRRKLRRFLETPVRAAPANASRRDGCQDPNPDRNTVLLCLGGQPGTTAVDTASTASTTMPNTRADPPLTRTPHSKLPSKEETIRFDDPT